MGAAAFPICSVCHEGQVHGKLSVDQILESAGHTEIVQRKAPYNDICPYLGLNDILHVVRYDTLSRSLVPAAKTPFTSYNFAGSIVLLPAPLGLPFMTSIFNFILL